MRRSALGVGVAVLVVVAGCATGGAPTTALNTTTATPLYTATPPYTTTPHRSTRPPSTVASAHVTVAVLPTELVGAWDSSGEDTEIAYRFLADGRYRSIEILNQPQPAGVFEISRQQDGTARVSGDQLRLRPTTSVMSRKNPDDPSGDYTNRPSTTEARAFTWQTSGETLVLTGTDGLTLRLERQP